MTTIRPFLARLLAGPIAALFLWLGTQLAVTVEPELITRTTEVVVDIVLFFGAALLTGYGALHRLLSKWFNPADVAAPDKAAARRL